MDMVKENEDETRVNWQKTESNGHVFHYIRFKCLMFSNNVKHEIYIHAEPVMDA